jgi:hypothetical protein
MGTRTSSQRKNGQILRVQQHIIQTLWRRVRWQTSTLQNRKKQKIWVGARRLRSIRHKDKLTAEELANSESITARNPSPAETREMATNSARRGEIVTKTQELRPALSCGPLPNHVLPLAHFGATSGVCDGGVVRTDHHNAGERSGSTQHYDLKVRHASVGGW